MDNFLTFLYGRYFDSINEEKQFRSNHFTDSNDVIRNDQNISNALRNTKLLKDIIEQYLTLKGWV